VVSLFLRQCHHYLFQKGEGFIDELCFEESLSFWSRLFRALWSSQVDKIQFADYNFLCGFDARSDFQMDREYTMWSCRGFIQFVLWDCSVCFAFKKLRYCVFLCEAALDLQSLNLNIPCGVLLNGQSWVRIRTSQQIIHHFVINLQVRNADSYLLFITSLNLLEEDTDASRDETTIFVVNLGAHHGEGLPSTSLTICHDSARITAQCTVNYLLPTNVENHFLTGILKNLIESKAPIFLLMIHKS